MNETETAAKARLAQHNNHMCVCACAHACTHVHVHVNIIGVEAWTGIFFHIHFSWLPWIYVVVVFLLVAEC
jgi:hypothetical protein